MLLWTDCRADLFAEGAGEIDRSPTVNLVRNSAMSVLEMSKRPVRAGTIVAQAKAHARQLKRLNGSLKRRRRVGA